MLTPNNPNKEFAKMDCSKLKFKLNSGRYMPLIGVGTYLVETDALLFSVLDHALAAGYRQIDTATIYENEFTIGRALQVLLPRYNLKREDIFITSKLSPKDQGDRALIAVENSLKRLQVEYIDLYLIHWPGIAKKRLDSKDNYIVRSKSWAGLVHAVNAGLVKDIGVSNYTVTHLNELLADDHGIKPAVNQVEWHPKFYQPELLELCRQEGILLQAYSSLGGTGNRQLLKDRTVKKVAESLGTTPAQVLLRWAVQQDIAVIPKACSEDHIKSNIDLNFEIPEASMELLNNLNSKEKFAWNPELVA